MPFPFTFSISVPGISNPFTTTAPTPPPPEPELQTTLSSSSSSFVHIDTRKPRGLAKISRPRPSPSHSPAPTARKRGWEPTFSEPSHSATIRASPSGYLDTPEKYRQELDAMSAEQVREVEDMMEHVAELPPAKRRRGLAGSIVSTALSAALIGTAVGLTVYRLWRDRGKEREQLTPPPPYQQEWIMAPEKQTVKVTPPTPRRKHRHAAPSSIGKRTSARRPRARNALSPPVQRSVSPSPAFLHSDQSQSQRPEFDFSTQVEPEVNEQMDWIGDKLSALIEEGKKALGREIVVMSDAQEDEIDDGSGGWEEENPSNIAGPSSASVSRQGSVRRHTAPRRIHVPLANSSASASNSYSNPSSASTSNGFNNSIYALPRSAGEETFPSGVSRSYTPAEDEGAWQSPEMRALMENARAKASLRHRGAALGG